MAARVGVERRDAHQPVHADLRLQLAVSVGAIDFHRRRLDSRAFTLQPVCDHGLIAMPLRPAQIHAQQHLRPVLAFGAAGAGMNDEDGAFGIVFAGHEHGGFQLVQPLAEGAHLLFQIAGDVFAFTRQLEQGIQIGGAAGDVALLGDSFLQPLALLHDLLAFLRLVPEFGVRNLLFEAG